MVLNSLAEKLSGALQRLGRSSDVDEELVTKTLKDITAALLEADVNIKLVAEVRKNIMTRVSLEGDAGGFNKARIIERAVFDELVRILEPGKEPFKPKKGKANVVMFVGLQGAGKTTTVAKYAHYYQTRRWKVAMVCADTFRAGAFDQLKQNATRVRVPFYGSYTETDPVKIAAEGVEQFRREGYEIIIVDTSGRHKQETALFEEMVQVQEAVRPDDIIFTMDSTIGQAAQGQAAAFKSAVPVGSVIITKLDGHAKGGGALSAVAATGAPIIFLGLGEHFDDLQPFEARSFISKMLGRGDIKGLVTEFKEKGIFDDQEAMMERLTKGDKFTLRDMYDQFQTIMKLGPLGKVMDMLPGGLGSLMSQMNPGGGPADSNARLKRFMVIMDSMTDGELDGRVPAFEESRILRIARGSGTHPQEVVALLDTYKQFEKMIDGMNKGGLLKGGDAAFQSKMARNPNAVLQQMQKSMDPRMLKNMGGMQNLASMMKGLAKGDMGDLMKNLGGGKMKDMMKGMGLG